MSFNKVEKFQYTRLVAYYDKLDPIIFGKIYDIIVSKKTRISLRLLEWFVTKYAATKKIHFDKKEYATEHNKHIFVNLSYKAQLKSHKKTFFDPFRRKNVKIQYKKHNFEYPLLTTICQLNFFKWAIDNEIIDYVEANIDDIKDEMRLYNKNRIILKKKEKESTPSSSRGSKDSRPLFDTSSLTLSFD